MWIYKLVGDERTDTFPWVVVNTETGEEFDRFTHRAVADQVADRLNDPETGPLSVYDVSEVDEYLW